MATFSGLPVHSDIELPSSDLELGSDLGLDLDNVPDLLGSDLGLDLDNVPDLLGGWLGLDLDNVPGLPGGGFDSAIGGDFGSGAYGATGVPVKDYDPRAQGKILKKVFKKEKRKQRKKRSGQPIDQMFQDLLKYMKIFQEDGSKVTTLALVDSKGEPTERKQTFSKDELWSVFESLVGHGSKDKVRNSGRSHFRHCALSEETLRVLQKRMLFVLSNVLPTISKRRKDNNPIKKYKVFQKARAVWGDLPDYKIDTTICDCREFVDLNIYPGSNKEEKIKEYVKLLSGFKKAKKGTICPRCSQFYMGAKGNKVHNKGCEQKGIKLGKELNNLSPKTFDAKIPKKYLHFFDWASSSSSSSSSSSEESSEEDDDEFLTPEQIILNERVCAGAKRRGIAFQKRYDIVCGFLKDEASSGVSDLNIKVEVKKSTVDDTNMLGLFANQEIKKGALITKNFGMKLKILKSGTFALGHVSAIKKANDLEKKFDKQLEERWKQTKENWGELRWGGANDEQVKDLPEGSKSEPHPYVLTCTTETRKGAANITLQGPNHALYWQTNDTYEAFNYLWGMINRPYGDGGAQSTTGKGKQIQANCEVAVADPDIIDNVRSFQAPVLKAIKDIGKGEELFWDYYSVDRATSNPESDGVDAFQAQLQDRESAKEDVIAASSPAETSPTVLFLSGINHTNGESTEYRPFVSKFIKKHNGILDSIVFQIEIEGGVPITKTGARNFFGFIDELAGLSKSGDAGNVEFDSIDDAKKHLKIILKEFDQSATFSDEDLSGIFKEVEGGKVCLSIGFVPEDDEMTSIEVRLAFGMDTPPASLKILLLVIFSFSISWNV